MDEFRHFLLLQVRRCFLRWCMRILVSLRGFFWLLDLVVQKENYFFLCHHGDLTGVYEEEIWAETLLQCLVHRIRALVNHNHW